MQNKIDIRSELHTVIGHLRRNEIINAYDLIMKMSAQLDEEFYGNGIVIKPKPRKEVLCFFKEADARMPKPKKDNLHPTPYIAAEFTEKGGDKSFFFTSPLLDNDWKMNISILFDIPVALLFDIESAGDLAKLLNEKCKGQCFRVELAEMRDSGKTYHYVRYIRKYKAGEDA